jgi:hypothetical protein
MVGGSRESSDTQLMKARRGALVIKGGADHCAESACCAVRGVPVAPAA